MKWDIDIENYKSKIQKTITTKIPKKKRINSIGLSIEK